MIPQDSGNRYRKAGLVPYSRIKFIGCVIAEGLIERLAGEFSGCGCISVSQSGQNSVLGLKGGASRKKKGSVRKATNQVLASSLTVRTDALADSGSSLTAQPESRDSV
jgi:hypothetical protein